MVKPLRKSWAMARVEFNKLLETEDKWIRAKNPTDDVVNKIQTRFLELKSDLMEVITWIRQHLPPSAFMMMKDKSVQLPADCENLGQDLRDKGLSETSLCAIWDTFVKNEESGDPSDLTVEEKEKKSEGYEDAEQGLNLEALESIVNCYFGYKGFRPGQEAIIVEAIKPRDVIAVMPTGGGKSLCFQVPALYDANLNNKGGVTIVVSPLLSLIEDQKAALEEKGVWVGALTGNHKETQDEVFRGLEDTSHCGPTLLYTTPEMMAMPGRLQEALKALYQCGKLHRIVLDEAHCITKWGHEFRPAYLEVSAMRQLYPSVPLMALTATATPAMREEISEVLGMRNPYVQVESAYRRNLKLMVEPRTGLGIEQAIKRMRLMGHESGIVYVSTRDDTENISEQLMKSGFKSAPYHAGMKPEEKLRVQTLFKEGKEIKVVVATIAFGMGIDKPDVRFVIHLALPNSLENYAQEIGRAGRDGKPSVCYLYSQYYDVLKKLTSIDKSTTVSSDAKERQIVDIWKVFEYATDVKTCRTQMLLHHFGEFVPEGKCKEDQGQICNNCENKPNFMDIFDSNNITEDARDIVDAIANYPQDLTPAQLVDIWCGTYRATNEDHPLYKKSTFKQRDAHRVVWKLLNDKILTVEMVKKPRPVALLRPGTKQVPDCVMVYEHRKVEHVEPMTSEAAYYKRRAMVAAESRKYENICAEISPVKEHGLEKIAEKKRKIFEDEQKTYSSTIKPRKKPKRKEEELEEENEDEDLNMYIEGDANGGYWCLLCDNGDYFHVSKKESHKLKYVVRRHIRAIHFKAKKDSCEDKPGKMGRRLIEIKDPEEIPENYLKEKFCGIFYCDLCYKDDPYGITNGKWDRYEVVKHISRYHFKHMKSFICRNCGKTIYGQADFEKHLKNEKKKEEKEKLLEIDYWRQKDIAENLRNTEAKVASKNKREMELTQEKAIKKVGVTPMKRK